MKTNRGTSIRNRIFIFLVVSLTFFSVVIIFKQFYHTTNLLKKQLKQEVLPERLKGLSYQISNDIAPLVTASELFTNDPFIKWWIDQGCPQEGLSMLREKLKNLKRILNIQLSFCVVNSPDDLKYLAYSDSFTYMSLRDYQFKEFYSNFLNTGKKYELNFQDMKNGQFMIFVNYHSDLISPDNNKPYAVAGIGLSANSVVEKINKLKISDQGGAMLVTGDGEIQIKSDKLHLTSDLLKQHLNLIDHNNHSPKIVKIVIDGNSYYIGALWVATLDRFLVVEVSESEMLAPIWKYFRSTIVFISAFLVVFLFCVNFFLSRLTQSINRGVEFIKSIASGDFTRHIDIRHNDEIGSMSGAMNDMAASLRKMFADIVSGSRTIMDSSSEISNTSEEIFSFFKKMLNKSMNTSASSEEMVSSMNNVAMITKQAAANIQTIVAAAEDMTTTINVIVGNTARGSETTSMAVKKAQDISIKVKELGKAATEISKVTETITDISGQTNLLALNATIEAARAGEAGKGFAVVAEEIKLLAQQTAEATNEIGHKINGVQSTALESVSAIQAIVEIINEIDDIVTGIARAIEEQSNTTQGIAGNMKETAQGLNEINGNVNQTSIMAQEVKQDITDIRQATEEINYKSQQIIGRAGELSLLANDLNQVVAQYKYN